MTMTKRAIPAGRFKAECLALLDDVATTGRSIVVTKRGRPVAEVVPVSAPKSLAGSVRRQRDLVSPIGEAWEADR